MIFRLPRRSLKTALQATPKITQDGITGYHVESISFEVFNEEKEDADTIRYGKAREGNFIFEFDDVS